METLHVKKMVDLVAVYKFTTLLTIELISRAVAADISRWTPKSARRQNRENGHTHRHTGQLL